MSHSARGAAATKEAPILRPIPRGRTLQLGMKRSEAGAALEALDGAGPGFPFKATEMET